MRRLLTIVCALSLWTGASGQRIQPREAGVEEYVTLLEAAGYQAFSFDLRELLADRYDLVLRIREYVGGELQERSITYDLESNKVMVSDFPADQQDDFRDEDLVDPATRTYKWAERLTVGFLPPVVDSVARVVCDIPGIATTCPQLRLRGLDVPQAPGSKLYRYMARPFKVGKVESGAFLPLVFFGSVWYDERYGFFRFCGEREIEPDLSSRIVADVPHFYVIGIECTRREEQNGDMNK